MACFWIYKKITDQSTRRVWLSETCIDHGHTTFYIGKLDMYGEVGEMQQVTKEHKKHAVYTLIFANYFNTPN